MRKKRATIASAMSKGHAHALACACSSRGQSDPPPRPEALLRGNAAAPHPVPFVARCGGRRSRLRFPRRALPRRSPSPYSRSVALRPLRSAQNGLEANPSREPLRDCPARASHSLENGATGSAGFFRRKPLCSALFRDRLHGRRGLGACLLSPKGRTAAVAARREGLPPGGPPRVLGPEGPSR